MAKKRLPPVEELLSDTPPRSAVKTFQGRSFCIQLMSRDQIEWAKRAAAKRVRADLESDYQTHNRCFDIVQDLLKNDASTLEARNNWFDCYLLQAALRDPKSGSRITTSKDDADVAATEIAKMFTGAIDRLVEMYKDFHAEYDTDSLTEEQLEAIADVAKKADLVSLMQFDASALRNYAVFSTLVGPEPLPPSEPVKMTKRAAASYKRELEEYASDLESWREQRAFVISQLVRSSDITSSAEA